MHYARLIEDVMFADLETGLNYALIIPIGTLVTYEGFDEDGDPVRLRAIGYPRAVRSTLYMRYLRPLSPLEVLAALT